MLEGPSLVDLVLSEEVCLVLEQLQHPAAEVSELDSHVVINDEEKLGNKVRDNMAEVQLHEQDGPEVADLHAIVLLGGWALDPKGDFVEHLSKTKECHSNYDSLVKNNVAKGGKFLRSSSQVPSKPAQLNL